MTSPRSGTSRRTRAALGLAALTVIGLGVAACAGGSPHDVSAVAPRSAASADSAASRPLAPQARDEVAAPAAGAVVNAPDSLARSVATGALGTDAGTSSTSTQPVANADLQPQIISTGDVSLRATARDGVFDVRAAIAKVVDTYHGQISQDTSTADKTGVLVTSHQVLRIPSSHFQAALDDLGTIAGAHLVSSSSQSDDVTTEVIDNAVRVRTQRASIDRIRVLLARAANVRQIISIEGELSRRETTLDSLEQRQAYLADQTSLSTITVAVAAPPLTKQAPAAPHHHHHATGFMAGLHSGWSGFTSVVTGVLTAGGAALPFALTLLVVGVPVWLLLRRRRSMAPEPTPATD